VANRSESRSSGEQSKKGKDSLHHGVYFCLRQEYKGLL
jgi:hypothetical protein